MKQNSKYMTKMVFLTDQNYNLQNIKSHIEKDPKLETELIFGQNNNTRISEHCFLRLLCSQKFSIFTIEKKHLRPIPKNLGSCLCDLSWQSWVKEDNLTKKSINEDSLINKWDGLNVVLYAKNEEQTIKEHK